MRTVELVCAPPLEETVRGVWERLAAAGLPSLARNTHPTNRPHLTLASVDGFPPGAEQRLADLCAAALPLPARLQRVEVLDGSAPLVWLVRPVPELVALHGAVWDVLADAPGKNPWHLPGRWMPAPEPGAAVPGRRPAAGPGAGRRRPAERGVRGGAQLRR